MERAHVWIPWIIPLGALTLGLATVAWAFARLASDSSPRGSTSTGPGRPRTPIPVAFAITDSATMIDFAGPWEVFQDVMLDEGSSHAAIMPFRLYTVGDVREPVTVTGGMKVVPDYTFADAPPPKVVVVGAQRGSPALLKWLQAVAARRDTDVVMSVCTGAFKLGDAGLLDGKAATTHHDFFDSFSERFPRVELKPGRRFVQSDDRIFTAGGLTSGVDLALHIVARYYGEAVASKTAAYMEYQGTGWRSGDSGK
jgi:transcriptional regulator GlxA family with amidase domain